MYDTYAIIFLQRRKLLNSPHANLKIVSSFLKNEIDPLNTPIILFLQCSAYRHDYERDPRDNDYAFDQQQEHEVNNILLEERVTCKKRRMFEEADDNKKHQFPIMPFSILIDIP